MSEGVTWLRRLRVCALVEGVSLLVLVCVAMPLKHVYGRPLATHVVGALHGALFVAFLYTLERAASEREWPWRRRLVALASSTIPGAVFFFDRSIRHELDSARPHA